MQAVTRQPVSLYPILLVNFIGTLGFSIVLPFLVILVTRFGGNAVVYGVMGATYSAFQLFGAPILGRWSDVQGRKRILLLSQAGTLFSWMIFLGGLFLPITPLASVNSAVLGAFVLTVPLVTMFLARALDGLTGGNVSVANAYLADITSEEDRKKNFGKMAVAANLGFIVGPALAGLLGATAYGEMLPVIAALSISLAATIVIAFWLPESKPCTLGEYPEAKNVRKVFGQEQSDCFRTAEELKFRDVFRLKNIPYLLALNFLIFLAFNLFYASFPVHATQSLAWTITDLGIFFSFVGLATVLTQGPLLAAVSQRYSDATLTLIGSVVLAAGFGLLATTAKPAVYLAGTLFSLGNGLMWPSFLALLSKAGDQHQGAVQGFSGSAGSLASMLGLILGGLLYSTVGERTFLVSAALIVVVFLLSLRLIGIESAFKERRES